VKDVEVKLAAVTEVRDTAPPEGAELLSKEELWGTHTE
jgi:hypothetical protein